MQLHYIARRCPRHSWPPHCLQHTNHIALRVATLHNAITGNDLPAPPATAAFTPYKRAPSHPLPARKCAQAFEKATGKLSGANKEAFRAALANALERRMFYIPSFKIYGSVAGFYDYGPPGCAIKANITAAWRQHFILEENMLEVECPAVTPEIVLKVGIEPRDF